MITTKMSKIQVFECAGLRAEFQHEYVGDMTATNCMHMAFINGKIGVFVSNIFGVAQRKRGGPITLRSLDRNQAPKH